MIDESYRRSMSEVLSVLSHSKREVIIKIPDNVFNYLLENSSKSYNPQLDHTKNIKEMGLSKKAEDFLSIIYRNYLCSEDKKREYDYILMENEKKYEEELREKYNPDNIFKNNTNKNDVMSIAADATIVNNEIKSENTSLVVKKDNFFIKIINKLKNLFNYKFDKNG